MSAARVSLDRIKEVLTQTNGNMVASAELLGMARNNLYKRIELAGINVNDFRRHRDTVTVSQRKSGLMAARISTESYELLRQATFDLGYVRRKQYAPGQVLEEFIADAFDAWLASKLAEKGGRS